MDNSDHKYSVIVSDRASEMLVQYVMFATQVSIESAENLRVQIIKAI